MCDFPSLPAHLIIVIFFRLWTVFLVLENVDGGTLFDYLSYYESLDVSHGGADESVAKKPPKKKRKVSNGFGWQFFLGANDPCRSMQASS